jgi:Mg2+ and Co2+ transporter CorA
MFGDGHLLLVLHAPPQVGEDQRTGRLFWREADGSWKSNALGTGVAALKSHLAEFAARLDQLDDELQTAASSHDFYRLLQAIAPLHRTARNLHATLQQAREMLPADRELINVRDAAGELERTAELLHGDIKNGLEFIQANQSEEQTRRSYEMTVAAHRLNLLVAMFFPIATLSTIFGMNLTHGLEVYNTPAAFWGVLLAGFVCGLLLTGVVASRPPQPAPAKRKTVQRKA